MRKTHKAGFRHTEWKKKKKKEKGEIETRKTLKIITSISLCNSKYKIKHLYLWLPSGYMVKSYSNKVLLISFHLN